MSSVDYGRLIDLAEGKLHNRPALLRAFQRLLRRSDQDGYLGLSGGVRGWVDTLSCGLGYVRSVLDQLADAGLITCDFLGDGLVEIYIVGVLSLSVPAPRQKFTVLATTQDQHLENSTVPSMASQSDSRSINDRSPQTPNKESYSESNKQQQKAEFHSNLNEPEPDGAVVEHLTNLGADAQVVKQIFSARPGLDLAQINALLGLARARSDVRNPLGLVLHVLQDSSGCISAPPTRSAPPARGRRADAVASPPPAADLYRRGDDLSGLELPPDRDFVPLPPTRFDPPATPRPAAPRPEDRVTHVRYTRFKRP